MISSIGTILEWFDFACFGYFASTFSHLFFPAEDKVASLAATFAVFAGAFIMRPVGGTSLGSLCAAVLHMPEVMSDEQLEAWGWVK